MRRQLKDKRFRYMTIKIDKFREVFKLPDGYEYKDKLYLIDIYQAPFHTMFSVKASGNHGKDLRKVFREIMKELYL